MRLSRLTGGKEKGVGSPGDWQNCLKVYGLTEAEAMAYPHNPIDNLAGPLAKAGVPVLAVVGDADDIVPLAENRPWSKNATRNWAGRSPSSSSTASDTIHIRSWTPRQSWISFSSTPARLLVGGEEGAEMFSAAS